METLDRQCEKFMGGPTEAYSERIYVTIDRGGRIFLIEKVHTMTGSPRAVYLYYNRVKDMIILEPTQASTAANAFTLKQFGSSPTSRAVYAKPFCKHFGIRPDGTLQFLRPNIDAAGRLYLKLRETISVTRGPRAKKKAL